MSKATYSGALVMCALLAQPVAAEESKPIESTASESTVTQDSPDPYRRSDIIMWTAIGFGLGHQLDHALRDEPLEPPFWGSFAAYPVYLTGYFFDLGPNYFLIADVVGLTFITFGSLDEWNHGLHEPISHSYDPWADGSNKLDIESRALGVVSVGVSLGLQLAVASHLVSTIADGINHGFTWKRRRGRTGSGVQLGIVPHGDGSPMAMASWRW